MTTPTPPDVGRVIIEQVASGGSGYGDPKLRPTEIVRKQVRNEIISIESALHDYESTTLPKNP